MNNNQLLIDAFLYFAKFPEASALKGSFNSNRSEIGGYTEFKAKADGLAVHSLLPGITDYVFGVDEKRVRKRIKDITGFYLLVDYGQVQSIENSTAISDSFYIAVTVARPFKEEDMDDAEEILLTQQAYTYIMAIKKQLLLDDRESLTKHLKIPADADPWHAPDINNSIGWTLMLQRTGVLER